MKNIIYLSLIASVLLCSCKGSSYMKQRYTHYGHGAKKTVELVAVMKSDVKVGKNELASQVAMVPENDPSPLASANVTDKQNVTKQTVSNLSHRVQLPKVKDLSRLVTSPSVHVAKANMEKQNASQAHRGLIFGLIDLALFIIIVAVIVAIILLLVLVVI